MSLTPSTHAVCRHCCIRFVVQCCMSLTPSTHAVCRHCCIRFVVQCCMSLTLSVDSCCIHGIGPMSALLHKSLLYSVLCHSLRRHTLVCLHCCLRFVVQCCMSLTPSTHARMSALLHKVCCTMLYVTHSVDSCCIGPMSALLHKICCTVLYVTHSVDTCSYVCTAA